MPSFNLQDLEPAEHVEEPEQVLEGWRGADVSEEELVDDQFIADDPDSFVVEPEEEPDGS